MKLRLLIATFCLGMLGGSSLWAHHSLAAEYDTKKPIKLVGKMTKLDWRNPHAWIYLEAEVNGKMEKWQCELGSPNAMTRAGFAQDSIKIGDEIVLDGSLAKDGSKTCSTRSVTDKEGTVILRQ
ncbi:MAG: DUF6152 family protein [Acidobacteriota bacterium]